MPFSDHRSVTEDRSDRYTESILSPSNPGDTRGGTQTMPSNFLGHYLLKRGLITVDQLLAAITLVAAALIFSSGSDETSRTPQTDPARVPTDSAPVDTVPVRP